MLALRLPAEIEQRLDALAKKTGRSKSYYAREAILRQRVGVLRATGRARRSKPWSGSSRDAPNGDHRAGLEDRWNSIRSFQIG
jgi:hypothetical protein